MSNNLVGSRAVEILGFYAGDFLGEYRKLVEAPMVAQKIRSVLTTHEFPDITRLDRLVDPKYSRDELLDINLLKSLGDALVIWGTRLSHFNTDLEHQHEWFDGGEDAGFYLGQIGYTVQAVVELLEELDPLEDYGREYIGNFIQAL